MVMIADDYKSGSKKNLLKKLLTFWIIAPVFTSFVLYTAGATQTGEVSLSRIEEYFRLENKIFRGENPLADANHDGKISWIEKAFAYEEMGTYFEGEKPSLEALRFYIAKKSLEKNILNKLSI
jgi:hypothetical protein